LFKSYSQLRSAKKLDLRLSPSEKGSNPLFGFFETDLKDGIWQGQSKYQISTL
jgi:hypothetical protein